MYGLKPTSHPTPAQCHQVNLCPEDFFYTLNRFFFVFFFLHISWTTDFAVASTWRFTCYMFLHGLLSSWPSSDRVTSIRRQTVLFRNIIPLRKVKMIAIVPFWKSNITSMITCLHSRQTWLHSVIISNKSSDWVRHTKPHTQTENNVAWDRSKYISLYS